MCTHAIRNSCESVTYFLRTKPNGSINTEYFTGNTPLLGLGHDRSASHVVHDLGEPFEHARAPTYRHTGMHHLLSALPSPHAPSSFTPDQVMVAIACNDLINSTIKGFLHTWQLKLTMIGWSGGFIAEDDQVRHILRSRPHSSLCGGGDIESPSVMLRRSHGNPFPQQPHF